MNGKHDRDVISALNKHEKNQQGFTLTEIAIVLGVVGLVLGAIWTAAATVQKNHKINLALTELMTTATNLANYFPNGFGLAVYPQPANTLLISMQLVPSWAIVNANVLASPWDSTGMGWQPWGGFTITANNTKEAWLSFVNIPVDVCINLTFQATRCSSGPTCPIAVSLAGNSQGASIDPSTGWQTLTLATATAWCNANPPVGQWGNGVEFAYDW